MIRYASEVLRELQIRVARLERMSGFSLGRTIDLGGQYFPVGAFRVKLLKDQDSSIFAGVTASPYNRNGDMVWGVIYGMGYRF